MRALNTTGKVRGDRTVLFFKCISIDFSKPEKSVGGVLVLVPRYVIELKAWGSRFTLVKFSRMKSSGDFLTLEKEKKVNLILWILCIEVVIRYINGRESTDIQCQKSWV